MTIIVGAIKGATAWVGADRQSTSNSTITPFSHAKVWRQGLFVIAVTGSWRESQIIEHATSLPSPPEDPGAVMRWLVVDVIDIVRAARKDAGFDEKKTDGVEIGPNVMLGLRGRLFVIYSDYQVAEAFDSAAIGCGRDFALGSLATTKALGWSAKRRVAAAIEATCAHDAYCGGGLDMLRVRR
jgi:hypothetical protein